METIVENSGDSLGYLGLTQSTGRIIVIDQASRFRAMKRQFDKLEAEKLAIAAAQAEKPQVDNSSDYDDYLNILEEGEGDL